MNCLEKKLYLYFINEEDDEYYNEIEKMFNKENKNITKEKQKIKKTLKKMRKELKKYNIFSLKKDSFNDIITINKEYNLTTEEHENLKKIINKLSEIHDIELSHEIEKINLTDEEIFYKFCYYYINEVESPTIYNELVTISKEYNFNFNEMQASTIDFIEKLKISLEKEKLNISYESFNNLLSKYKLEKKNYTDNKKEEYLKILASLSKIYNINLREELTKSQDDNITDMVEEFINPLDNNKFIKKLLQYRYDTGSFNISYTCSDEDIKPNDKENYDSIKDQANLTLRLINIFYDKLTNYAEQDLNEFYLSLINEEDYERISKLTQKDIYTFLIANNKHIDKESICNKLNINNSLYNYIYMTLDCTYINENIIGYNNKNMFKSDEYEPSYVMYLNTPNNKCTYEFLEEYIIKCIEQNMDYYLKGLYINGDNKNRTIIYSSQSDFNKKINIIKKIIKEHPGWSNKFGTPINFVKTNTESLFSISNYVNKEITYIEYFDDLCEVSYYRVLAKILSNKLNNDNELNILNSIINLNNINPKEIPSKTIYNAYTFDEIKDTINRHIPDIINTIRLYIEEEVRIDEFIKEFKKSVLYIYNINNKLDKKNEVNIFLNL